MKLGRYEVLKYRNQQIDGTEIGYLRGIDFSELLGIYLRQMRSSEFLFIQVGAHNGVSNDFLNRFILKLGLRGILVEPQQKIFKELCENYKACPTLKFENIAIGNEDGDAIMYTIRPELDFLQYVNQVASLNREHTRRMIEQHITHEAKPEVVREYKSRGLTPDACIVAETVRTRTFSSLLASHAVPKYDLLQIDTEGYDFEVLKAAGIDRYRPGFINYEHEHLSQSDQHESWRFLSRLGYHLVTHGRGDTAAYRLD